MSYNIEIERFLPDNIQEKNDKKLILEYISKYSNNVLLRENEIAHITSSGFIMNKSLSKVLLIHHNIRKVWAWTGGHADGVPDLLKVAQKEAHEETGISYFQPLNKNIASIDILPMFGHMKNGKYISAHLHLSIAYILVCDEAEQLQIKPDENSAIKWFEVDKFTSKYFDDSDVYLYNKLIARAKTHK